MSSSVAVAIGSNLGDRRQHVAWAVERLADLLLDLRVSSFYETDPAEVVLPQPPYLNAAAVGVCDVAPAELLASLLLLEQARGRTRLGVRAPRTLDLDLILHGSTVLRGPGLTVPHPRFRNRRFVLEPLAEVAPDLVDPETGLTVEVLWKRLVGGADPGGRPVGST